MQTENSAVAQRTGVITRNIVPMFSKPDCMSEQVTQGLFGQMVTEEGGQGDWVFVQTWDTYRAWVPADRIHILDRSDPPYASAGPIAVIRELFVDIFEQPHERAELLTKVTISTEIEVARVHEDWVELKLPNRRLGFIKKQHAKLIEKAPIQTVWLPEPRKLAETAMRFVGVPYLWGGSSPFGLDCSGLVQLIYRIHNVTLLRDAHMQASDTRCRPISGNKLAAGDLIFFAKPGEQDEAKISHVGMMLGKDRFIHSRGGMGVIITPLDDPYYTSIYHSAAQMRLKTLDSGGGAPQD
ncbi:MAG: C40 family peptidase [Armatimonadetes bacterium]|nr:C40 family peptidase [Armatimonadota bacterium]